MIKASRFRGSFSKIYWKMQWTFKANGLGGKTNRAAIINVIISDFAGGLLRELPFETGSGFKCQPSAKKFIEPPPDGIMKPARSRIITQ